MIITALNQYDKEIKIEDVQRGKNCNCFCKNCKAPLIAKKGKIKKHHFTHCKGYKDCGYNEEREELEKRKYTITPKSEEDEIEKHNYTCKKKEEKLTYKGDSINFLWNKYNKAFIVENNTKYILVLNKRNDNFIVKIVYKNNVYKYNKKMFNNKDKQEITYGNFKEFNFIEFY